MSALKNLLKSSLIRYGLVGVANTLFGLMMIYLAKIGGAGDVLANLFGYCCGLLLSFKLNTKWTFRYGGRLLPAFYKFSVVIAMAYLLNLGIVLTAIQFMTINSYIAQALGIVPYTIVSFLGLRYFVFPAKNEESDL